MADSSNALTSRVQKPAFLHFVKLKILWNSDMYLHYFYFSPHSNFSHLPSNSISNLFITNTNKLLIPFSIAFKYMYLGLTKFVRAVKNQINYWMISLNYNWRILVSLIFIFLFNSIKRSNKFINCDHGADKIVKTKDTYQQTRFSEFKSQYPHRRRRKTTLQNCLFNFTCMHSLEVLHPYTWIN